MQRGIRTVLLFFSSGFCLFGGNRSWCRFWERFFCSLQTCLMEHHASWIILKQQYLLPSFEQFVLRFPCLLSVWPQPYKTLLWWFIQTYGGCFCQVEICLGFFSQCGISERYLWSFFMFIVYPDLGTDTTQQACQCHEADRQTSHSKKAVFYKK